MTFSATSYDFQTFTDANHYIGGEWVDGAPHGTHPVINPRHGQPMANVQFGGVEQVIAAVQGAVTLAKSTRDINVLTHATNAAASHLRSLQTAATTH